MKRRGHTTIGVPRNIFCKNACKGQLTIFIIVGIILVASVSLFFMLRGGITQEFTISDSGDVQFFVESCIDEVGTEVVERVGAGGGYYFVPEMSVSGLAIYSSKGENYIPSKEKVEEEISLYVAENLFFCVNNFADFTDVIIEQGDIEVITTIKNEEVVFDINYPIRISKGESVDLLRDFENTIFVRLGIIYDSLEELINLNKESICLTCFLENDLKLEINNVDENNVMFVIRDEVFKLNDEVYEWAFAMEY